MEDYKIAAKISEGRFGTVFAGLRESTGEKVAIKKIRARRPLPGYSKDPWTKSGEREIEVLQRVRHPNVVLLLEHATSAATGTTVLVYELLAWPLDSLLDRRKPMDESHVKAIMQMLLCGLAHLHGLDIMHRDIKPANLIFEAETGKLKIADFGSARFSPPGSGDLRESPAEPEDGVTGLTREVCTRWYKSPEMLFGSVDYTLNVDLWATGCVLGDLLSPTGEALFPGVSDIDQLCCIFRLVGTPHEDEWPEVRNLPDYNKIEFAPSKPQSFAFEGSCSTPATQLLRRFLQLNPADRVSALDAPHEAFFHTSPAPVSAPELLIDLGLLSTTPEVDDRLSFDGSDFSSDAVGSEFEVPGSEFEAIPIETTSCGLWDGIPPPLTDETLNNAGHPVSDSAAGPGGSEPANTSRNAGHSTPPPPGPAQRNSGHSTPPPPGPGGHRFKANIR
mmetsp:Transcript_724/g.1366  ORF Transcript_724/g.1366 Transcript_724/m.1366 type:complete len:447 (+) Transcript_724:95-1435(+)